MLLADEKKIIGRFDARLTADDPRPASTQWADFDPGLATLIAANTAGFCDYARRTLKYDSDLPYEVLTGKVRPTWNLGPPGGSGYLDMAATLASAMRGNPHMKLMFASGYFDLATPYLGTDYTLDHMNLPPDLRANIKRTFYAGGHMVYQPKVGREKLKTDVTEFMHWAVDDAANAAASQPAK
jgi:carboxypeptidase C (cathepsin A)